MTTGIEISYWHDWASTGVGALGWSMPNAPWSGKLTDEAPFIDATWVKLFTYWLSLILILEGADMLSSSLPLSELSDRSKFSYAFSSDSWKSYSIYMPRPFSTEVWDFFGFIDSGDSSGTGGSTKLYCDPNLGYDPFKLRSLFSWSFSLESSTPILGVLCLSSISALLKLLKTSWSFLKTLI